MEFNLPGRAIFGFIACIFLVLCPVNAYFGQPLLHGADNRFDRMGEARIDTFEIQNGSVVLDIILENAEYEEELWLLDFQPYDFDLANPPIVTADGGKLVAANTGSCSNVFSDKVFDENTGFYVDGYLPLAPGDKDLFTSYQHGTLGFETDDKGVSIREDRVQFTGGLDTFLNCTDTSGNNVWERNVYSESIQFNTTLYVTNVRPKNTADGESGISYIQSHIILYWRLIRTAIARFIITSTERLRPIFEYAIVRPIYVDGDVSKGPEREKTEVELSFKTISGSDTVMAVYDDGSLAYTPERIGNSLWYVKEDPKEVTVYFNPTTSVADIYINGESVPICPSASSGAPQIGDLMCGLFGKTADDVSPTTASPSSTYAITNLDCGGAGSFADCTYDIGTSADCSAGSIAVTCEPLEPADLPKSCHDYLQQAKRVGITLTDGLYDIDLGDTRFQVYCDMTRNGGGWTLILTTEGQDGFDATTLTSLNRLSPSLVSDYSILGVADLIKDTSDGDNFRYRIESGQRGQDGGIWEAPIAHDLFSSTPQATTNIDIFGDWEVDLTDNGGPQNIVPYVGTGDSLLTTGRTEFADNFGTVVCTCSGTSYDPAPWLDEDVQPGILWYWFKEDRSEPTSGTLHQVSYEEPMLAPTCDFTEYPDKCTQTWTYTVILNVDDTNIDSQMPVDANGEFEVSYQTFQCPDLRNSVTIDCEYVNVPLAVIGAQVTLQTVVQIVDETKDKPIVKLKSMYGTDPAVDLRDGARGVQHLEVITLETHFFPEFLRENLEMELTLFMVCVGDGYRDHPDGCFNATVDERYVAYLHPEFFYESATLVDPNDVSQGYIKYDADSVETPKQALDSHEYVHDPDIHRSVFTNRALSAVAQLYTITNVFKLVPRNEPETTQATVITATTLAPNGTNNGTGGGRRRRDVALTKRDLKEEAKAAQTTNHVFQFAGCPDGSEFDLENKDCLCVEKNEVYSTETFKCEAIESRIIPDDDISAGRVAVAENIAILASLFTFFVVNLILHT